MAAPEHTTPAPHELPSSLVDTTSHLQPPRDRDAVLLLELQSAELTSAGTNVSSALVRNTSKAQENCDVCKRRFREVKGKARRNKAGIFVCTRCYNREKKAQTPQRTPTNPTSKHLSLTPDQLSHLTTTMKKGGVGKQGRSRSAPENARAVLHLNSVGTLQRSGVVRSLSFDNAVKSVAAAESMSHTTLRQVVRRFETTGELTIQKVPRVTLDDPNHVLFGATGPPLSVQKVIFEYLKEAAEENVYISLRTIRARIFAVTNILVPRSTLHNWMRKLSITYGEKKLSGLKAKYARALIRKYILDYSRFKYEEKRGDCVLVWMDESYIHAGYCSRFSWHTVTDKNIPVKNRVRGNDKGKRLIIIHAMTKDGMLEKIDLNDEPSDNLEESFPSAAIVTNKLSADGFEPEDYHDTLNGDKFLAWMKNRLFPAFRAKYPRKKMILILDNAKYHHARGEDWVNPNKMKKVD